MEVMTKRNADLFLGVGGWEAGSHEPKQGKYSIKQPYSIPTRKRMSEDVYKLL